MQFKSKEEHIIVKHDIEKTAKNKFSFKETLNEEDRILVKTLTKRIDAIADREDLIQNLKREINAGTYTPNSHEIVEAMIRRVYSEQL